MPGPGFAVIDLETTRLFPGGHDRIVELAVVHVDDRGVITGQWETLLNPGRDLGPQQIHGIRAAEILDAPTFAEIVPQLVELLEGRVPVAHNARFDAGFLFAELEAAGVELWQRPEFLCTMLLARDYLPGSTPCRARLGRRATTGSRWWGSRHCGGCWGVSRSSVRGGPGPLTRGGYVARRYRRVVSESICADMRRPHWGPRACTAQQ